MPKPLYEASSAKALNVNQALYQQLSASIQKQNPEIELIVPPRSGKSWRVKAGQLCRISTIDGPQVVDFNMWSGQNPRERFWASRTRQMHGAHMRVFDRFWSCLPYFRPMATVTADTVNYGIDAEGAGCHDLLGTRCDPYVHKILTGEDLDRCCHSNLVRAVAAERLTEMDIHDVLNIFQVTGLTADTHEYFVKPCPAKKGDYFEFFAEIDLLCALSTCPHGDMSKPIWGSDAITDPTSICRPIGIQVYSPDVEQLKNWQPPSPAEYRGLHGMSLTSENE